MSDLRSHVDKAGVASVYAPLAMYDPSAYIPEMSRQDSERASHRQRQVRYEAHLEKTTAFRQRRTADTARWRERLR